MPGTQMTSVFEGQAPKTRPFPIKTRVSWVPGEYKSHVVTNGRHFLANFCVSKKRFVNCGGGDNKDLTLLLLEDFQGQ